MYPANSGSHEDYLAVTHRYFFPFSWPVLHRNLACGLFLNISLSDKAAEQVCEIFVLMQVSYNELQVESSYEKQNMISFISFSSVSLTPGARQAHLC